MKSPGVFCFLMLLLTQTHGNAQIVDPKSDLLGLKLIPMDLTYANQLMTAYDLDESGAIEKTEQKRLRWKDEVSDFDLDRNGKLTQSELAIREAKRRDDDDITQMDIDRIKKILRAHDKNRNGQLDPDEVERGWVGDADEYDTNHDGILTQREMHRASAFERTLQAEQGILGIDQLKAVQMVKDNDLDGDRKLDAEERQHLDFPRAVQGFDQNNDDRLGIIELATMLAKHRRDLGMTSWDQRQVNELFQRHDKNRDGKIDQDDVGANRIAAFTQYDSNSDHVITVREVEDYFAANRKKLGFTQDDYHQARAMLMRHDANRSKRIEIGELFESPTKGQLSKSIFEKADQDQSGAIDLNELARYFASQRAKR